MRFFSFASLWLITFFKRFGQILALSMVLGIILFLALTKFRIGEKIFVPTERIGIVGRFTLEDLPLFIQNQLSLGLTTIDEKGLPKNGISSSWEEKDGGKTWIFRLDDNYYWQDGSKVTSKDINYQFEGVVVKKPDLSTIEFDLKDPYSPFPVIVSKPVFKKGLLGAGEFKATKIIFAGQYIKEILITHRSENKRILYRFYPTEDTVITAFKLGEIDKIKNLYKPPTSEKNMRIEESPADDRFVAIFFNIKDPVLGGENSKILRQALAYAIDKQALGKYRATSPIMPNSWAYNPLTKPYDYSTQRAKELIDNLPSQIKSNLVIKLVTIPTLLEKAKIVSNYWEAVGIKTKIQVSSNPPSDYQALMAIQVVSPDPDQYGLWHSTQTGTNISGYQDFRIDKLLEDGRKTLNLEERKKIYLDFQRFLVEDSPAIFLYIPEMYSVVRI